jgi:hypothetical protein
MTAFVDNEKRKGDIPIPDNLEEVLNEAQRQALPGIVNSGWELRFLRRPMFQEPVLVLRNDNRTGILDTDGRIKIQADIKVRDQENQTQTTQSDKPLVWTK